MLLENEEIISKADVLEYLKQRLIKAHIAKLLIVNVSDYFQDENKTAKKIGDYFWGKKIVIRSSSKNEDGEVASNAGHFDSVLNVDSGNTDDIKTAMKQVIDSYDDDRTVDSDEKVLCQEQIEVSMSGVVFTRDLLLGRPYFMVNYDDDGSTDSVTSGKGGRVLYIARNANRGSIDKPFDKLVEAVDEILTLTSIDNLDIEFGITAKNEVYIFQTRPLAAVRNLIRDTKDDVIFAAKEEAKAAFLKRGHKLSDMAFWNPSEIIGDNPFPLDYSLYREIITSFTWSAGISAIGYHYINDDLMYKIGNKPYISLDYSFESLVPELLSPELRAKLKRYYEIKLKEDLSAHDKIEFEIVFSVFDFCTEKKLEALYEYGFTKDEVNSIHKSLFFITVLAINEYKDVYEEDMHSIKLMQDKRREIREKNPLLEEDASVLMGYICELLTSIKTDGTPQFARQARLAFMARSFCRTLVEMNYVERSEMDSFMQSISTVASEFERDFDDYSHGRMKHSEFIERYGHLRLGTYNLRTESYKEMYKELEDKELDNKVKERPTARSLDISVLEKALKDYEIDADANELADFIKHTTENREYFKFEFTKSLSLILDIIVRIGDIYNISREDMSYVEISDFFEEKNSDEIRQIIYNNKVRHDINSGLILPEVILSEKDIDMIYVMESRPNFITSERVRAEVVCLDDNCSITDIEGKIVAVKKADPGYDWIFTANIAGFVTRYGGAASHMAIRCAEFSIPAAIGCGEKIYNYVVSKNVITLDAKNKEIK